MAELTNDCCTPTEQAACCEPSEKAACCGESHTDRCGCAGGTATELSASSSAAPEAVRETVRERYAAAAVALQASPESASCSPADRAGIFGSSLYAGSGESTGQEPAVSASLGCGVPTAVADLH